MEIGVMFWLFSTVAVFSLLFCMFQIDEKFACGAMRKAVEDEWIVFLILNIIPVINILVCLASMIVFVIILIESQADERNLRGNDIIKKIFFIKDGK